MEQEDEQGTQIQTAELGLRGAEEEDRNETVVLYRGSPKDEEGRPLSLSRLLVQEQGSCSGLRNCRFATTPSGSVASRQSLRD